MKTKYNLIDESTGQILFSFRYRWNVDKFKRKLEKNSPGIKLKIDEVLE